MKYLIIGTLAFGVGVWLLIKFWLKHRKIDTESIAVVKEIIDLGINFYNALLEKSDKELEKGNLPREEIAESKHYIEEL